MKAFLSSKRLDLLSPLHSVTSQKTTPVVSSTARQTKFHVMVKICVSLTLMGPCFVNIFQYVYNKMQPYTVYLYLETDLHVSGGTSTHHQERIQLYLHHLVFVTSLLLPAGSSNDVYMQLYVIKKILGFLILKIKALHSSETSVTSS
jgi:hypothetical protein